MSCDPREQGLDDKDWDQILGNTPQVYICELCGQTSLTVARCPRGFAGVHVWRREARVPPQRAEGEPS